MLQETVKTQTGKLHRKAYKDRLLYEHITAILCLL